MKKTEEIIGLPIISICDAIERGKVNDIIINDIKGAIDYVVVDEGLKLQGTNVIPSDKVVGIGRYALTIESVEAIADISNIEKAKELVSKNVPVKGTRVLTKKGRLVGEIGDFYVDEDNKCMISALEFISFENKEHLQLIPRSQVITFGKNYIVVEENLEEFLLEPDDQQFLGSSSYVANESEKFEEDELEDEIIEEVYETEKAVLLQAETIDEIQDYNTQDVITEAKEEVRDSDFKNKKNNYSNKKDNYKQKSGAGSLFEQKQRQFLKGKIVTKSILDNGGAVLVKEGTLIDDGILTIVSEKGKMVELVMNNRPN